MSARQPSSGRPFPSPIVPIPDRAAVLVTYLDFFRATAVAKVSGLTQRQLRASVVPSGWSPLDLLYHLTWVERRWLEWGFEGRPMPDPWGDQVEGRWTVPEEMTAASVIDALVDQGAVTRRVATGYPLAEVGQPGPRWDGAPPATLERVLFHLLQEYARHVGHLDIARELLDGATGE